jgi:hypothetical protein
MALIFVMLPSLTAATQVVGMGCGHHFKKLMGERFPANVSSTFYSLIDRSQKHSEWKYPERKWNKVGKKNWRKDY